MIRILKTRRGSARAFVVALGLLLTLGVNATYAAQMRVVMKDGRLFIGSIFPTKSVAETTESRAERDSSPVASEKILAVDDELRRIYIPKNNVADLIPDESGAAVDVFRISQRVNTNPNEKVAALGSWRVVEDFDLFGRRVIVAGNTTIVQGVTEIAPTYVRVQGLTHNLDMRLSPYVVPREILSALIKKQIDPTSLEDRLRVYQFYVQAALYEQAVEELQEIIKDFEQDESNGSRLDVALRLIKQMSAERLINELEMRRAAGQHKKVRELIAAFEEDRVSPEKLQALRRMRREFEAEDKKRDEIIQKIDELVEKLENEELKKGLSALCSEIKRELSPNTLGRFAAFEQALVDSSLNDSQRLAIALSGWLVGNVGADSRIEMTASLYRVRQATRRYLLESRPLQREELWKEIKSEEAATPKFVALILENMKPPKSPPRSAKETPAQYEISVPSFQSGKNFTYCVQLPPEYDPNKKYPAIVSLHGERSEPINQLNWWCGPWTEKVNAQGKKVYERYGQASRYGYIVVAPKWTEKGIPYDFSAVPCAATLYCLRDALRTFSIDVDRVFLAGFYTGADAVWDVALGRPDLWAGIIPICGEAKYTTGILKKNAEFVPVYGVGGELDGGKIIASRETLDWGMDLSKPFDMTYVLYKGRGQETFAEETAKIFEWMGVRSRRFMSPDERVAYSARPWDNFFWCAELFDFPSNAMVDPLYTRNLGLMYRPAKTEFFKVVNNRVRVVSNANRGVIFLSPELVDFDRKIEVLFNGKKLTPQSGRVEPSTRVILEDARTRADRQHPFWASLNSELPGQTNEWDHE